MCISCQLSTIILDKGPYKYNVLTLQVGGYKRLREWEAGLTINLTINFDGGNAGVS
jgi:hypothetical protein